MPVENVLKLYMQICTFWCFLALLADFLGKRGAKVYSCPSIFHSWRLWGIARVFLWIDACVRASEVQVKSSQAGRIR